MGILFHKVAFRLVVAYVGKAVPFYIQARNLTYATVDHAALER